MKSAENYKGNVGISTVYYNGMELILFLYFSNISLSCFVFIQLFKIFSAVMEWKTS
jgi:hypothetical protein